MSWVRKRPLWACFLLALGLRASLAVLTEYKPLFPAYYYTDAILLDRQAWDRASAPAGEAKPLEGSPSQRLHAAFVAGLYRAAGHRPLVPKLFNSLLGALCAPLLFLALRPAFGDGPALGAAWLAALWPSHVFFTSQNFKDAFVMVYSYGAMASLAPLLAQESPGKKPIAACVGVAALLLCGLFRAYVMLVVAGALGLAAAWRLLADRTKSGRTAAAWALAAALLAPLAYKPAARVLFLGPLAPAEDLEKDPSGEVRLVPAARDGRTGEAVAPFSPQALTAFRRFHQDHDQAWAGKQMNRRVGTQLFREAEFESWSDVLIFLPKGLFHVLFMPLPGLYPMDGNSGRMLSGLENLALLSLSLAALAFAVRAPWSPGLLWPAAVFLAMAAGSALLEPDLGSATRHKTLFFPLLFPFAAAWVISRVSRRPRYRG